MTETGHEIGPEDPGRRRFLVACTGLLSAGAAGAALTPAVRALLTPLDGGVVTLGSSAGLVDLGPLDAFEAGVPRKVAIRAARTDAFVKEGERALGSVLVVRAGNDVRVFASVCPHAGCDVSPSKDGGAFTCPCHESRFGLDGKRALGPSPRDLDPLEARVVAGRVQVRFERFQVGSEARRVV